MMIDSLIVSLGLDASGFEKGQQQTATALKKLSDQSDKTASGFEAGGKVMATAFDTAAKAALGFFAILAGGKSLESLMNVAKTDAAVGRLAKNLDMLPGKVKTFENAAVAAGSTAGAMDSALGGLSGGMEAIDRGQSTPLLGVLNQLQLGYKKADGTDMQSGDLLLAIFDKFSKMDPRDAAYLGSTLGFDPSITSMGELGMPAIQKLLADNKSNLDQQTVDQSNALIQAFGRLETATDNVSNDLLKKFGPDADSALDHFTKGLDDFDKVLHGQMTIGQFLATSGAGLLAGAASAGADTYADGIVTPDVAQPPAGDGGWGKLGQLGRASAAQMAIRNQGLAYFQGQGYTANQAAGIMANVDMESGFNPNAVSADGGAHGLFQWRGARWAALVAKYGPNPTAAQQFQFAQDELNSSEAAAKGGLLGTTSAFGAGVMFDRGFERSGDNMAQQYARGAAATAISLTRPGGVPYSAQSVLNNLRAAQSVTVHNNIKIDAKGGDPKRIARELRKTTATTITAARANTGLD